MIPWLTVETLAPEGFSVASVGTAPRGFADWRRVLQRQLAKMPALYDSVRTKTFVEIIRTTVEGAQDVDREIATASGPHKLLARPIFGPGGGVHGVRLWLGPGTMRVPAAAPAVGAVWDVESQTIHQPSGMARLSGITPQEYAPSTSVAEFFHRISAFDQHAAVLDLLYGPRAGEKLQFDVSVTQPAGRATRWRISIRARDDPYQHGAWLLIEDITAEHETAVWPTLESVGLREAHRRAGNYLAIVPMAQASIAHWLTDPAPWIRWEYLFRPVDVFHPSDRQRLLAAAERLRMGESVGVTVRTLNYSGGHTPTTLLLYPYPGYSRSELAIAQVVRALDSGLQPLESDPDPGPPLGYDEQLRYRMTNGRAAE